MFPPAPPGNSSPLLPALLRLSEPSKKSSSPVKEMALRVSDILRQGLGSSPRHGGTGTAAQGVGTQPRSLASLSHPPVPAAWARSRHAPARQRPLCQPHADRERRDPQAEASCKTTGGTAALLRGYSSLSAGIPLRQHTLENQPPDALHSSHRWQMPRSRQR